MADVNNMMSQGRYRGLIVSIALFLTLIGALLAFTFYTSSLIERNTVLISTTNQVANDAQSVIKDLFDLDNSYGEDTNSPHIQRVLNRLETNSHHISSSLDAIAQGGKVEEADGEAYELPAINDEYTLNQVTTAQHEWALLQPKVDAYLENADNVMVDSADNLSLAVDQAKTSSLLINQSLDTLTNDVFSESQRQAETIRLIQILGVIAILTYFVIFVFFFVRRLRESDAEALEARRETQEIMQTVGTGLFLLDKDLKIGQQHSKALEGILGTDRLAGEDFSDILRGRISDKDLNTTRQFIEQLYNPRVKEKLVDDLNPLRKVMLHNSSADQNSDSRYLDFKFSRVYEGKKIARILVNVMDVSEAVKLEKRLELEREQNDMQIEMLATILNVEPKIINEFIKNTKVHIEKMNNILKNPGSSQFELESKLKSIYREMHSLKGESSSLKLHSFTKIASDAEDKLHAMQNQGKLSGNDFLPLAVNLDELLSLSNTIETLGERINQASPAAAIDTATVSHHISDEVVTTTNKPKVVVTHKEAVSTASSLDSFYQDFANEIAQRQGKKIELTTKGLSDSVLSSEMMTAIKEITIQLLRNAIVHGIELPGKRLASDKPEVGHIDLELKKSANDLVLSLKDDGQGVNYDHIRQSLAAKGQHSADEVTRLTEQELQAAMFSSGFSTRDNSDEDGGRGIGLDIIKDRVESMGGKIELHSEPGQKTEFVINLPL